MDQGAKSRIKTANACKWTIHFEIFLIKSSIPFNHKIFPAPTRQTKKSDMMVIARRISFIKMQSFSISFR